jgi:hypothetical protein
VVELARKSEPTDSTLGDAQHFQCAVEAVQGARIRFEMSTEISITDAHGSTQPMATLARAKAEYRVRGVAWSEAGLEQASVELLSYEPGGLVASPSPKSQSGWAGALAAGWIHLREPFQLARRAGALCIVEDGSCDARSKDQASFVASLEPTLKLLFTPELTALDGQPKGTHASIALPESVAERVETLEASSGRQALERQQGAARDVKPPGGPAPGKGATGARVSARGGWPLMTFSARQEKTFVGTRPVQTPAGPQSTVPQTHYWTIDTKLRIDSQCRLRELDWRLRTTTPLTEDTRPELPSAAQMNRRVAWKIRPERER